MTKSELENYCTRLLDMTASELGGETSYQSSYSLEIDEKQKQIIYTPHMPSSTILTATVFNRIYQVLSVGLFPKFTLLKQASPLIIERKEKDFYHARSFAFPYIDGIPERLEISNFSLFSSHLEGQEIPIMKNLTLDYSRISCLAISGQTGSGKSMALSYLIRIISRFSDMVIVDPKFDSPARLASELGIRCISPVRDRSGSDFLSSVNEILSEAISEIYRRQDILFTNPDKAFKPLVIVIDELLALKQQSSSKAVKDSFDSLINIIALMGRATSVRLILSAQTFNANDSISTSARGQISCAIQLGKMDSKALQYLFPDLSAGAGGLEGIVVPPGPGCGIIQVIDGIHPSNVLPVMMPSY